MSQDLLAKLQQLANKYLVCKRPSILAPSQIISQESTNGEDSSLTSVRAQLEAIKKQIAYAHRLKSEMEDIIRQLRSLSPIVSAYDSKLKPVCEKAQLEDELIPGQYELTTDLSKNHVILKNIFQGCSDVEFRSIKIFGRLKAIVIYVDGLTDYRILENAILKPLMHIRLPEKPSVISNVGETIIEQVVAAGHISTVTSVDKTVKNVLEGNTVILVEGETKLLSVAIGCHEKRNVDEPATEVVIRGPREGFTEDIRTNISLLRKRLRTPWLKLDTYTVGELSQTKVIIVYIKGVARAEVVEEVKERLGRIKIDGVLESGYIEEFIEDNPYSPFPLVQNTERPDVVAANLLEGKIALFTDNTPFVLLVPIGFFGQVQSNEDYYSRFSMGTFLRGIRLVFMFAALVVPAIFVAITTFHPQMIPTKLLISIIDSRERTPFPAVIEVLLMEIAFEALREAGIRLPKPVGQAVSIVGALVIGQSAVMAGLVSAPMVIVVSLTGIASFTIPHYDFSFAIRVLRFPLIILSGAFGLFGTTVGVLGIHIYLVSLRSFGVPYYSPFAPLNIRELFKDVLVRAPRWSMNERPNLTTDYNDLRVPIGQKPEPAQGKGRNPEAG